MPTYEYICEACLHEFEKFQSIKADAITVCPACAKETVRRKISAGAGILFKGGGFYETDYRSAGYKEAKQKDSDAGGGKGETKPETKSEAKADTPAKTESPAPKTETQKAESKPAAAPQAKTE